MQAGADLAARLRAGFYDAVVGIGGGRTIDVAKYAASLSGLPVVAVATRLAHDGIASPVASLDRRWRRPQVVLRRHDADRRRRRPRLRAAQRAGDAPLRDRRRDQQPVGDRGLAAGGAGARRGGRRRGRDVRAHRRHVDRAPRGRDRRRRVPDRAGRVARPVGPGDGHGGVEPARAAAATTRSCTRSTTCSPAPRATASWRAPQPVHLVPARRRRAGARHRQLPDPPRAAAHARRSRAVRGAVRRGGQRGAGHAPGPLHDPRAPGARRGRVRRAVGEFLDAYDR